MDAKELTKKFYELSEWKHEAEKRIEYLEQENQKLRRLIGDMSIDLKNARSVNQEKRRKHMKRIKEILTYLLIAFLFIVVFLGIIWPFMDLAYR